MKFACPKCNTRYSIADDKVPVGKIVKFPCKQCSNVIRLRRKDPNDAGSVELGGDAAPAPAPAQVGRPVDAPSVHAAATVAAPLPQALAGGETTRVADLDTINALRSQASDLLPSGGLAGGGGEATRVVSVEQINALRNASAAPAPSPFDAPEASDWYVLVGGKQKGPMPRSEVEQMLDRSEIDKRTFVWKNGMASWERLAQVPEFKDLAEKSGDASWRVVKPAPDEAPKAAANGGAKPSPFVSFEDATSAMDVNALQAAVARTRPDTEPQRFYKAETVVSDANVEPAATAEMTADVGADLSMEATSQVDFGAGTPTGEGLTRDESELAHEELFGRPEPRTTGENPLSGVDVGEALQNFDYDAANEPALPPPPSSGMENVEANPDYMTAPPGESTRVFMATAGLYKRRRNHRIAAVLGVMFAVLLIGFVAMDITGLIEIPGMGAVYDIAGVQDPNLDRALERTEHKLAEADLDPTKRAELESLRRKLLGKSQEQQGKVAGKGGGDDKPKEPAQGATTQGIEDKQNLDQQQRDMAQQLFADARKQEADIKLSDPTAIQTPNLPDGLTQEAIFKVIQENNNSMKLCFAEAARKGEKLAGKMEVQLTIDATGAVTTADVTTTQFKGSTMGTCTVKRVKGWKFPRFNGEPVTVVFPYVLTMGM